MSKRKRNRAKESRKRVSLSSVCPLITFSGFPNECQPEVESESESKMDPNQQVPLSYSQMVLAINTSPTPSLAQQQFDKEMEVPVVLDGNDNLNTSWPSLLVEPRNGGAGAKQEPVFRVAGLSSAEGGFLGPPPGLPEIGVGGAGFRFSREPEWRRERNSDSVSSCTSADFAEVPQVGSVGGGGVYVPPHLRHRREMPLSEEGLEGIPGVGMRVRRESARAPAPPVVEEEFIPVECRNWSPWDSPDFHKMLIDALDLDKYRQPQEEPEEPEPAEEVETASVSRVSSPSSVPSARSPTPPVEQPVEVELPTPPKSPTPTPPPPATPSSFSYSKALKTPSTAPPPPPPAPKKITSTVCPGLVITPLRSVNFTGVPIQFAVTIEKAGAVNPEKFEVVAVPPSGRPMLECRVIRKGDSKDTVQVFFMATSEVGWYRIKVKCQLKSKKEMSTLVNFLVSRNYYRESCNPEKLVKFPLSFLDLGTQQPDNLWGLACDRTTNKLYYTESFSHTITCIDPIAGGKIIFRGQGALVKPTGLCCDERHRRLAVCERGQHRVVFLDLDSGQFLNAFGGQGEDEGMFECPWDISMSPCGTQLCVSDLGNHRIQVFDLHGKYLRQYPQENPTGVAFGQNDEIYATDWYNGTVTEVTSGKVWSGGAGRVFKHPQGLVVDSIGGLLVADKGNNSIRHFATIEVKEDEEAQLSVISKVDGNVLGEPVNVAVMGDGRIAVLEETGNITVF